MKLIFPALALLLATLSDARSESLEAIAPEDFCGLHAMFKTQPGESLFWDLPWMIQLDEAIARGAKEGKPLLVWCGAGGAPVGVC
jgi:hypothetical protein